MSAHEYESLIDEWVENEDKKIALNRMHAVLVRRRDGFKWAILANYVMELIRKREARQRMIEDELLTRWDFSSSKPTPIK